jgi:hypothetical protein
VPGRRQQREIRRQVGEAFAAGGLVMLVVTPVVYKIRASRMHVVTTRSLLWPTPLMILPLLAVAFGLFVMFVSPALDARRRAARHGRHVDLDLTAADRGDDRESSDR